MSILRAPRPTRDYTDIRNTTLEDDRLSYGAIGLLCYVLSKPDHWVIRTAEIMARGGIGRTAYTRLMRELEAAGYAKLERLRSPDGKQLAGTGWVVTDCSVFKHSENTKFGNAVGIVTPESLVTPETSYGGKAETAPLPSAQTAEGPSETALPSATEGAGQGAAKGGMVPLMPSEAEGAGQGAAEGGMVPLMPSGAEGAGQGAAKRGKVPLKAGKAPSPPVPPPPPSPWTGFYAGCALARGETSPHKRGGGLQAWIGQMAQAAGGVPGFETPAAAHYLLREWYQGKDQWGQDWIRRVADPKRIVADFRGYLASPAGRAACRDWVKDAPMREAVATW